MAILNKAAAIAARVALDLTPIEAAINEHLTAQRTVDYVTNDEIDNPALRVIVDGVQLTVAAQASLKAAIEAAGWNEVIVAQEPKRVVVSFQVNPKVDVYVATVTPTNPSVATGGTVQLVVTVTKNGAPYTPSPTFSSGTPAKATVSGSGLVTGVATGSSVITVSEAGKYSVTKTVNVTA
jgi:uncharacterized protein YjdB